VKVRVGERERDGERERGLKHIYFIIYHVIPTHPQEIKLQKYK